MNYSKAIFDLADFEVEKFGRCQAIEFLKSGGMRVHHYAEILRQFHHYTKENPGLQVLAATRFRGTQRQLVRKMFLHATAEVGHDQLALDDLVALGYETKMVPFQNPLPSTLPLITFPIYQITTRNPIGYLGCILFLERLPVQTGGSYMQLLTAAGIPKDALSFIADHTNIDVHHNKLMEEYLEQLVRSDQDYSSVCFCLKTMSVYYADMLWGAIQQAENPMDWGRACEELANTDTTCL